MPPALCLTGLFAFSGAALTYLYDHSSSIFDRVAIGTATGLAAAGLAGFLLAIALGLETACFAVSLLASGSALFLLLNKSRRRAVLADVVDGCRQIKRIITLASGRESALALAYVGLIVVFFLVFQRAMFFREGGLFTGVQNDYGDLMLHLAIIARFAKGANLPPMDPTYAGIRFTYPFLSDFIAAMFVKAGASLREAMLIEGLVLATSTLVVLRRFAVGLTGSRMAGLLTTLLVFFSGGLGWVLFISQALYSEGGALRLLQSLPQDYTITRDAFRWGNSLTALLAPQRSLLLGLPLALIVFSVFWQQWRSHESAQALDDCPETSEGSDTGEIRASAPHSRGVRCLVAAGVMAGMLPFAHTHTFLVVMGTAIVLAAVDTKRGRWVWFFAVSLLIAAPQLWWLSFQGQVHLGRFFEFHPGWETNGGNFLWSWFRNTGAFVPLLIFALTLPKKFLPTRLKLFYLPFGLCFIVPNLFKLAPWEWDNIKVLFYWFVGSTPLVALVLAMLWRKGLAARAVVLVLVGSLTLAGALDVWRIVSNASEYSELTSEDVAYAGLVEKETAPDSLILHAPIYNDPIVLTGRQSFMEYPGHIWTRGIDYRSRLDVVKAIYSGRSDARNLISRFGIQYAVVSPAEEVGIQVDAKFFEQFPCVVHSGNYRLYKLRSE